MGKVKEAALDGRLCARADGQSRTASQGSAYPLIERLGLDVFFNSDFGGRHNSQTLIMQFDAVKAEDLERVLASAPLLKTDQGTHDFLAVGVQPIQSPDTAESLLREFIEVHDRTRPFSDLEKALKRARKLLEQSEGK